MRPSRCRAHQASLEAGSPELIRNIRRGRMPSVARLRVLCEVLELEFYIGPRREAGAIDERRLREAVASADLLELELPQPDLSLYDPPGGPRDDTP